MSHPPSSPCRRASSCSTAATRSRPLWRGWWPARRRPTTRRSSSWPWTPRPRACWSASRTGASWRPTTRTGRKPFASAFVAARMRWRRSAELAPSDLKAIVSKVGGKLDCLQLSISARSRRLCSPAPDVRDADDAADRRAMQAQLAELNAALGVEFDNETEDSSASFGPGLVVAKAFGALVVVLGPRLPCDRARNRAAVARDDFRDEPARRRRPRASRCPAAGGSTRSATWPALWRCSSGTRIAEAAGAAEREAEREAKEQRAVTAGRSGARLRGSSGGPRRASSPRPRPNSRRRHAP